MQEEQQPEISVVMPCLNEDETLGDCIRTAARTMARHHIAGEIIVADNGSTDRSADIARREGARVVPVKERGYGNALMGGIEAARSAFVLMGDADGSYDFCEIPRFLEKLREGYELVQGCRLPSGGGRVRPGAMPPLHAWLGNPFFSMLARRWFDAPIHDVYCGMRAFRKDVYQALHLRCTGMEFATEMIIKASLQKTRTAEVPITLHPDARKTRQPHLKTWHDGWRTLRFFLISSPRLLFWVPGLTLMLLGCLGYAVALPNLQFAGVVFDAHTLLFSSLALIIGYQSVLFALFTKIFAISERFLPADPFIRRFCSVVSMEKALLAGGGAFVAGLAFLAVAVNYWRQQGFGPLDYSQTMRWVIPGVTLAALGFQTVLSGFFISILGMRRR